MTCKWQVEIDPFCQKVLAKHWPNVARYEDVRTVGKHNLETVDLICGGFPCQDVSTAGNKAGLYGERSTLWFEYARIIRELRPRWVLVENVGGLLSINDGYFFGEVLRHLDQGGYDAEWDVFPAQAFGAPHARERVFVVAYSKSLRRTKRLWKEQEGTFVRAWGVGSSATWPYATNDDLVRSGLVRVCDGIPDRVDRLTALGNAVVPQVAEWIGKRIMEAL